MIHTGKVVALQRYPVKSMLGERLDSADVTVDGIAGDRAYALLDVETGRIASAKQPRLWRDLLTMSYAEADEELLSQRLGRSVRLVKEAPEGAYLDRARPDEVLDQGVDAVVDVDPSGLAPGTFFDFAPLHIITTASLELIGRSDFDRYRPNIVIETDRLEYDWVDRTIHIGQAVVARVLVPTPRCAVPTLAHGDWPADTDALRVPARINRHEIPGQGKLPCLGVYASVERPGRISIGDSVRLE